MPTFIAIFVPFFLKITIFGLENPYKEFYPLRRVAITLDYILYPLCFLDYLFEPNAPVGAGWLYPAAIAAGVALVAVDIVADILCRLVKKPGMYGLSLKLRYVCCGFTLVIVALYAAMRLMGMFTYDSTVSAILGDATAVLCIVAVGAIVFSLKRRQKDYSDS